MTMKYEVSFYDEEDECVEGYFFAMTDPHDAAYDAIERANDENVGYEYAELRDFEDERLIATYRNGEWEGEDDEWYESVEMD